MTKDRKNASFESFRYMRKCEIKQNSQEIIKKILKKNREKQKPPSTFAGIEI